MIPFKEIIKKPLKDTKGFTLMELMIVIALIAVLASFAMFNYIPARTKALDSAAMSDARNIVNSVIDAIMNSANVDFTKVNTGGPVGNFDTGGNPRTPVFVLSPGVIARIAGDSIQAPGGNNTIFAAFIYHSGGTPDPVTPSGRKEFFCFVDEDAGTTTVPTY
jgi:prepilin-type N-terminal cleavage/methylation domain-containing protein